MSSGYSTFGPYQYSTPNKYKLDRACLQCMVEESISGYGPIPMGETCKRCGTPYQDRAAQYDYAYASPMPYFSTSSAAYLLSPEKPKRKKKIPKSTHNGLLVGFRYWRINDYQLAAINLGHIWKPGEHTAECRATDRLISGLYFTMLGTKDTTNEPDHQVPNPDCTCGIHLRSVPDPVDLSHSHVSKDDAILGACLAWGRILMHGTAGARVQHARPILLAYDPTWTKAKQGVVKGLAQDYDCRTVPVSYPDVERGVCDELLQAAREYGKLMGEMGSGSV